MDDDHYARTNRDLRLAKLHSPKKKEPKVAKEFKNYDKQYKAFQGTGIKKIVGVGGRIPQENIDKIDMWPYAIKEYTTEEINYAVYNHIMADEWQRFRVGLKGLTTKEKLYCLGWYWDREISPLLNKPGTLDVITADLLRQDLIRVNNYISALKRGGLLDSELRVIK